MWDIFSNCMQCYAVRGNASVMSNLCMLRQVVVITWCLTGRKTPSYYLSQHAKVGHDEAFPLTAWETRACRVTAVVFNFLFQLLGFGLSILDGIDPNPDNFVSSGILHTRNQQIGCLVRLEPNRQAEVGASSAHVVLFSVSCPYCSFPSSTRMHRGSQHELLLRVGLNSLYSSSV